MFAAPFCRQWGVTFMSPHGLPLFCIFFTLRTRSNLYLWDWGVGKLMPNFASRTSSSWTLYFVLFLLLLISARRSLFESSIMIATSCMFPFSSSASCSSSISCFSLLLSIFNSGCLTWWRFLGSASSANSKCEFKVGVQFESKCEFSRLWRWSDGYLHSDTSHV